MTKSAKTSLLALIFILIQVFGGVVLNFLPIGSMGNNEITISFYILLYLVPLIAVVIMGKDNLKESLYLKNPGAKNIIIALLITICLMPFVTLLSYISMLFFPNIVSGQLMFLAENESIFLTIIALAVCPAVCEELIFRGKLFSGYREGIGMGKAIFMSGLIFGIAHFNLQQFLYAFILGMIFALMVTITGSIFVSIIPHFVINASQVFLSYFLYKTGGAGILESMEKVQMVSFDLQYFTALIVVAVLFLIPAVLLLKKLADVNIKKVDMTEDSTKKEEEVQAKEKMFTAPVYVILGLFVIYAVSDMI